MIATMLKGSANLSRWLLLAGLLCYSSCQSVPSSFENKTGQNDSRPRVFSPRMDYDEWTPLGRGDPLKNNPTFDYVPPVLDRVQYWLDSHTTEPSAKRDILVLGVTAKKTSPKIPEHFLKFVDGPKFTRNNNQDAAYRNDFTGSTGAEPPKVVRTTNFRNGPIDYRNQNRIQALPASYYPSPYYQKTKPYTMMLPPPLVQKPVPESANTFNGAVSKEKIVGYVEPTQQFSTQTEEGPVIQDSQFYAIPSKNYNQHPPSPSPSRPHPQSSSKPPSKIMVSQIETIKSVYTPPSPQPTKSRYETMTTPSVSFEKSNLIYQSTQTLTGGWPGSGATSTSTNPDAGQSTWQTSDYPRDQYETDHHVAAASSHHEVVVEQNANIIVDGDNNENEEVVMGQKEVSPEKPSPAPVDVVNPTKPCVDEADDAEKQTSESGQSPEKMHIVMANSAASDAEIETHKAKKGPVAVVMPTNYPEKKSSPSSQVPVTPAPVPSVENTMMEEKKSSEKIPNKSQTQPPRNSVTGSPIFEDIQSPNRMMTHHLPQPAPSRHPGNVHMFGAPQAPLQSLMHPQQRPNHAMMHFLGSMRPNMGFRPGMSMSPPMAHMHAPAKLSHIGPMDMAHRLQFMFTSPAPPTPTAHVTEDHSNRRVPDMTTLITTPTPFLPTVSSTDSASSTEKDGVKLGQSPLVKILSNLDEETTEKKTTDRPVSQTPQTTTVPSLTTDPIFSHYKQPAKPIRGPMYLIIQGHSKVKTYKPTVNKHGVPVERNEIVENATERLSKFDQFIRENTKPTVNTATENKKKLEEKERVEKLEQVRQDSLMSIVESGLGSFTVSPSPSATEEEHQANSVTTIEINGN